MAADTSLYGFIGGIIVAAITAAAARAGSRQSAKTQSEIAHQSTQSALTAAQVTGQTATERLLFDELKRVQERSDTLEKEFRFDIKELNIEIGKLNARLLTMEIEKTNLITEHAREIRIWEEKDRQSEVVITNLRVANVRLADNQTKLIEHIQSIDKDWKEEVLMIGDVEIKRKQRQAIDRFSSRMYENPAESESPDK